MPSIKGGLGKGLDALFPSNVNVDNLYTDNKESKDAVVQLKINDVEPNVNQPRKSFDDDKLTELADSIKEHGVIQPIIVTKKDDYYQIIAGERRWRASKKAGLKTIPAIVRTYDDKKTREVSLIENIQRQNLNPLETAQAIRELMDEHHMTQEDISKTLGKSRSSIANTLRILNLDDKVKDMIEAGQISEGHARTLASIDDHAKQYKLALDIVNMDMSVREAESYAKEAKKPSKAKGKKAPKGKFEILAKDLEKQMREALGAKVTLDAKTKSKGRIIIEYSSEDELDRIIEKFGI
jgi:ParB family chromosome partitioning protein